MLKKGFTIIELLIVIAIISILVGVAVPYYNDYITDARLSVLKQNAATMRSTINQFRGDNIRGPLQVKIVDGATTIYEADIFSSAQSELSAGPVQIIDGLVTRRPNVFYLTSIPAFTDPFNGGNIPATQISPEKPSNFFYDANNDGIFDVSTEWAFFDGNNNGEFLDADDKKFDSYSSISKVDLPAVPFAVVPPGNFKPLDYTDIVITDSAGNKH